MAGETIAAFDASALRLSDDGDTQFRLVVATDIQDVIEAQNGWFEAAETSPADPHFHWPAIYHRNEGAVVLVLCNQDTRFAQAMMQIRLPWLLPCDHAVRGPLAYVSFVEVAPWNQPGHPHRRFKQLGTRLIARASQLSLANGLMGVLGLHSVQGALPFYSALGFKHVDCPNEYRELYLELDADKANALRSQLKVSQ